MTKFETKYAPKTLNDIVYPSEVIKNNIADIGNGSCHDNVLLFGPHGTAKSTTVKLMFEARYGSTYQVGNYYDGADLTSAAAAKDAIQQMQNFLNFQKFTPAGCVIVIDEIDFMHMSAQKSLRSFMQKFPFVRFMFTTNNETSVYSGIRSVCRLIEFPVPAAKLWLPRAQHILHAEGVQLPDANVLNMLSGVSGSARDVCRLLQDVVLKNAPSVPQNMVAAVPAVPPASPAVSILPPQQNVQPQTPNAVPNANVPPTSATQPNP